MSQDDKRRLRKLKRDVKRAGNKRRRRALKQFLGNEKHDHEVTGDGLGRTRSAVFNGMDRDAKRKRWQR
jgi:hypothetical protein